MNTMLQLPKMLRMSAAAVAVMLLLVACGDKKSDSAGHHDHGSAIAATVDQHDDHGEAVEKLTHLTDRTELFVEFPALVVGQPSVFAAHVTQLADFKPVTKGTLTVVLAGESGAEERFISDAPSVPGIFKPNVTPKQAGERELTIIVESAAGTATHELGPVTVYADTKAAQAGHGHDDADDGIAFSKEQQWKSDFAIIEAVKGTARASVTATATIKGQPDGEALLAAPAAGIVRPAAAFPRVGQAVKKGQVLAHLAPRLGGETDQASLDAAASKARIALEQAKRERERMDSLFRDEAVPEKRAQEARAAERIAQAEWDAAQARAAQAGGATGIAIRAPIDGVVADVAITAGTFVAEGAPLFHVAKTGHLWLEARVPESEIGRLGKPTGAAFAVDGFERTFMIEPGKNGRLVAVGGVVDKETRTIPVIFELANPDNALRLGMMAKAQLFASEAKEAVLVPASAVQDESGAQVVYVQTGGESFERQLVQVGARDGDRLAILSGLEPGQRVVSKGAYLIRLSTSKTGPSGHAH